MRYLNAARRLVLLAAFAVAAPACNLGKRPREEPPLRPLLYTENDAPAPDLPGWELWTEPGLDPHAYPGIATEGRTTRASGDDYDRTSPEGVMRAAYDAATQGDLDSLLALALDAEGLVTYARVPIAKADERKEALTRSLEAFMKHFRPDSATDARPDGLSGLIQPTALTLGPPRTIQGAIVENRDDATMYSANTLRIHVLGSTIDFDVRFPRLLKTEEGDWKIAEAPTVSDTWEAFRRPGLDLKAELLDAEHAPFPFDVGNYWHYEVKRVPLDGSTTADDTAPTRALAYRDTVSEVFQGTVHHVVTLRRTFSDPARSPETRQLLVTTRHIYPCSGECYRRRDNLSFLMGYMGRTTPLMVAPSMRNHGWREGGRPGGRTTRVAEISPVQIIVPAGSFANVVHIRQADGGTGASVYFTDGIGILREELRQGAELQQANLVQYRILR